ncbi:molybdopterin-dependent oxidoreductase [Deinococcus maricopensis]|uniref:Oxidoreductase molybdopterin-binding domain-containing protein n=1 Tax=Deinococcus maricopensis (strain DSM 21211 / LMG 22137 / NRRL B-23946 / LB-34) TaxID=709986 RepID=E8U565_DEIML|nr:molybdopterin-dependent oxidoreductase [Deinococcus maricopensis]ADV66204.1 hypothetical protein Deima_0545 [Deinococcus maricopensis DSM 21211]
MPTPRWPRLALLLPVLLSACGRDPTPATFPYTHGARPAPAARPGDPVALTVYSARGPRTYTLAQLRALPAVRYRATQPQLRRTATYEGVALRDLVRAAGLPERDVRVEASNLFSARIPASEYLHYPIMIAYAADGHAVSTLDKGPLQVILPNLHTGNRYAKRGNWWVWFAVGVRSAS